MPNEDSDYTDDLFIEESGMNEDAEDIGTINTSDVQNAVVSATDWTTETILSQINKGNILLDPDFQRRDAWDQNRKSLFIESLFLGLPIPQLVLAESKVKRGSFIVIDGKQRLLTIRRFASQDEDTSFAPLKLSSLKIRSELNGHSLESLRKELRFVNDIADYENQPIRTTVLRNWQDEQFLYDVFIRINSGSLPLSTQELRQALQPGPFVSYVENASAKSEALRAVLRRKQPDFRMRDAELFVRFFAFKNFSDSYKGSLKDFLDSTCAKLNASWDMKMEKVQRQSEDFEQAHITTTNIFNGKQYRKWGGTSYEPRFNRAIFDVMTYYFSIPEIRAASANHKESIEEIFKTLCLNNSQFVASIERTTKSLDSTRTRFEIWASALSEVLNLNVQSPQIGKARSVPKRKGQDA